jgi:hypothetical protein
VNALPSFRLGQSGLFACIGMWPLRTVEVYPDGPFDVWSRGLWYRGRVRGCMWQLDALKLLTHELAAVLLSCITLGAIRCEGDWEP